MQAEATAYGSTVTDRDRPLQTIFAPPRFDSAEQTRIAWVLHMWLLCLITISTCVMLVNVFVVNNNVTANTIMLGTGIIGCVVLLRTLQLGHVRRVSIALVIGSILFNIYSNVVSLRPFPIGVSSVFIMLMLAGVLLTRFEFSWVVAALGVSVIGISLYWATQTTYPINLTTLLFDAIVYFAYCVGVGVMVYITTGQLRLALKDATQARQESTIRMRALEHEMALRVRSEHRQDRLARGLRGVLDATNTLIDIDEVDAFWFAATRFGVERLGLDLCGIYVFNAQSTAPGAWYSSDCGDVDNMQLDAVALDRLNRDTLAAPQRASGWRVRGRSQDLPWPAESYQWIADSPLRNSDGKQIGVFYSAGTQRGSTPDPDHQDLMSIYGSMLGHMAERKMLEQENRRLHHEQLRGAALNERSRLARELHDSVSQSLFGIVLGVRTIKQNGLQNDTVTTDALDYVFKLSESALAEMRSLVLALRPETLENEGFLVAFSRQLQALCARSSIELQVDLGLVEPDVDIAAEEALYRIGLEAVQNAIKHAQAQSIGVRFRIESNCLRLIVSDDGCGFDVNARYQGHLGLHTMRERTELHDGKLSIVSQPGAGTTITVLIPRD